jgi:hypothetical protein
VDVYFVAGDLAKHSIALCELKKYTPRIMKVGTNLKIDIW